MINMMVIIIVMMASLATFSWAGRKMKMERAKIPPANISVEEQQGAEDAISSTAIRMSVNETALFLRYISRSKSYFEFGSGGSTVAACVYGPDDLFVYSVDPNERWLQIVGNSSLVQRKLTNGQLTLKRIDIGPLVGNWSVPSWTPKQANGSFETFSRSIDLVQREIDLVLVDSRFRVACAIKAMLSKPNATILFHDFYEPEHHGYYNMLLHFMDVVDWVDTSVVLARRVDATEAKMMKMYLRHAASYMR